MTEQKHFTLPQIAQHKSKNDCWIVVNGRVLNVTKFLEEHPGGEEVLLEAAGRDATKEFEDVGHSKAAQGMLSKFQVGVVEGLTVREDGGDPEDARLNEPKDAEMSAFVIKDDDGYPKLASFVEFFVPLLVAGSYLAYQFLTPSSAHLAY